MKIIIIIIIIIVVVIIVIVEPVNVFVIVNIVVSRGVKQLHANVIDCKLLRLQAYGPPYAS